MHKLKGLFGNRQNEAKLVARHRPIAKLAIGHSVFQNLLMDMPAPCQFAGGHRRNYYIHFRIGREEKGYEISILPLAPLVVSFFLLLPLFSAGLAPPALL